jgi:hypothetical protein
MNLTPKELSEMALARIELHPESWDQSVWHCGTTHCYAGHIDFILLEQNCTEFKNSDFDKNVEEIREEMKQPDPENMCLLYDIDEALGLTVDQFIQITSSNNSLECLYKLHNLFFKETSR